MACTMVASGLLHGHSYHLSLTTVSLGHLYHSWVTNHGSLTSLVAHQATQPPTSHKETTPQANTQLGHSPDPHLDTDFLTACLVTNVLPPCHTTQSPLWLISHLMTLATLSP